MPVKSDIPNWKDQEMTKKTIKLATGSVYQKKTGGVYFFRYQLIAFGKPQTRGLSHLQTCSVPQIKEYGKPAASYRQGNSRKSENAGVYRFT